MNQHLTFSPTTKLLIVTVIVVHLLFFLLESVLWMRPEVYTILIYLLNNPVSSDAATQALTLKNVFINQGFYNLFLAGGGIVGWNLVSKAYASQGLILLLFLCVAAAGAGIILACTTKAYLLAAFQALPGALAFFRLYPAFRNALNKQ